MKARERKENSRPFLFYLKGKKEGSTKFTGAFDLHTLLVNAVR
jgi:hypothetical protein